MPIVLFEDELVTQLYPITVGKPAAAISCASYSLIELLRSFGVEPALMLRRHLREIAACDGFSVRTPCRAGVIETAANQSVVYVNARLVPSPSVVEKVIKLAGAGKPCVVRSGDEVVVAIISPDAEPRGLESGAIDFDGLVETVPNENSAEWPLFRYPHDVVRYNLEIFNDSLSRRLQQGSYREIADGVFAAEGAKLGAYCVTEVEKGPILLDAGATVGPHCFLRGPVYLGPASRLTEQSALKDCVSLGHTTKIGGEVEASVVEPYTNKQHHGFLGHSYLGSWVNLGAGTCNSDLKNTYGQVKMDYGGKKVATEMQFFGAIVGDYVKTAINTGIFTGKTIGACSMVYGFVTTNVPSFVNYARSFGQVTEVTVEILAATQARMFARRKVSQRLCDMRLLQDIYDLTQHERQMAGEPLAL